MNEDGPNDSPYGMLAKYDQSETKCDRVACSGMTRLHTRLEKIKE
jgi:hypothetical protein